MPSSKSLELEKLPRGVWLLGNLADDPILDLLCQRCDALGIPWAALGESRLPEIAISAQGDLECDWSTLGVRPALAFNRVLTDQLVKAHSRTDISFSARQWSSFVAGIGLAVRFPILNQPQINAPLGIASDPVFVRGILKARGFPVAQERILYQRSDLVDLWRENRWLYVRDARGLTLAGSPGSVIQDWKLRYPAVAVTSQSQLRTCIFVRDKILEFPCGNQVDVNLAALVRSVASSLKLQWGACVVDLGNEAKFVNVVPFIPNNVGTDLLAALANAFDQVILECFR